MTFSKEWDERFKANTHISRWPWSDLVSYVMRYARPTGPEYRVLELGCAAGPNIPFFLSLGVKYFAVEGSETVVRRLWERFPDLKDNMVAGDFTQEIPFPGQFDLVVDRGSLTHNSTAGIVRGLALVQEKLKTTGKYIGIDWFSTVHTEYQRGRATEDPHTRRDYTEGPVAFTGRVHFSDKAHLLELFKSYEIEVLEHKVITRELPESYISAWWSLVARKG
jgi:SAM-dependent methyltransferase